MVVDVHRALVARPRGTRLVVLSDFDGTLADFDDDPSRPRPRSDSLAALSALSVLSDVSLGLVSGRRVADLAERVALPSEVYMAGLHGLEIAVGGRIWEHPAVAASVDAVAALAERLAPLVDGVIGARLERKGSAVAVHLRSVALSERGSLLARAMAAARPWTAANRLYPLGGADVLEFLPTAEWNKGHAVRWIADDVRRSTATPPWVVYFGDDLTDEDAFRAADVSVVVGRRPSVADLRLASPAAVAAALADIAAVAAGGAW